MFNVDSSWWINPKVSEQKLQFKAGLQRSERGPIAPETPKAQWLALVRRTHVTAYFTGEEQQN